MDVGVPEFLIVLVIILLVFGVGRIGKIGRELGEGMRAFRTGLQGDDEKTDTFPLSASQPAPAEAEDAAIAPVKEMIELVPDGEIPK